jgi:hypothetical protein
MNSQKIKNPLPLEADFYPHIRQEVFCGVLVIVPKQ